MRYLTNLKRQSLPQHSPPQPIQIPIIRPELGAYALAGLHDYALRHNDPQTVAEIEAAVSKLPIHEQQIINKLKFYRP